MSIRRGIVKHDCIGTFEKYLLCDKLKCIPSQLKGEDMILLREFLVIMQEQNKMEKEEMERAKKSN